ncbi:MAG: hypothetical protein V7677_20405, partial [Motiliproteus sp.]
MSKVAQIRHFKSAFQPAVYQHQLQQKAADSWWVFRSEIGLNGQVSPFGRVVFFARGEAEAVAWIDGQKQQDSKAADGLR